MRAVRKRNSIVVRFFAFALVIIFGVLLILFAADSSRKHKTFEKTTAVITDIQTIPGTGDDADDHEVYVSFTVGEAEYNARLDEYASSFKVGKEVGIYYNPSDPTDITSASNIIIYLGFIGGPLLILFGLFSILRGFLRR